MSGQVRTILGDVDPCEIQAVLPHEHTLLYNDKSIPMDRYVVRALPTLRRRMRAEFRKLISRGCNCFVDCNTTTGIQIPDELCALAQATGMHFVAATGFYVAGTLPNRIKRASVDELAQVLMRSVTQGIAGSQARAGVVKVSGNGYTLEPVEERTFRAAARVHRERAFPLPPTAPKGDLRTWSSSQSAALTLRGSPWGTSK